MLKRKMVIDPAAGEPAMLQKSAGKMPKRVGSITIFLRVTFFDLAAAGALLFTSTGNEGLRP